jgi:hypothetical protein
VANRLLNSWELVKASARVLQQDKSLLLFPVISFFASVFLILGILVVLVAAEPAQAALAGDDATMFIGAVFFFFYVAEYFVVLFCNAGLVSATLIRLRGGTPTVGEGMRIAAGRAGSILLYAMLSATAGTVLRTIAERAGFIGRFLASLLGAAWGVATFLVVPAMVHEQLGAVDAIKRSVELLKKSWGEQLVAGAGIHIVFNWLTIVSLALFIGGLWCCESVLALPQARAPLCGLLAFWVVGLSLLRATLSGIFSAALYRFAAEGDVGSAFDPQLIQGAFRPRARG